MKKSESNRNKQIPIANKSKLPGFPTATAWEKAWQKHWSKVGLPGYELPVGGRGGEDRDFLTHARTPEKERARLKRELANEDVEIDKIDKKPRNEQFVAKAQPEVIEEQRTRREEAIARRERLEAALARLS